MSAKLPVSFAEKSKKGGNPAAGGYPYQISASDLDKNFVFAALDVDDSLVQATSGQGGHPARKLKIPAVPEGDKLHVLGAVGGTLKWIATEEC
jgi:hypothetical protein